MAGKRTVQCYQMCLPFGQNEDTLKEQLSRLAGAPLELTLTNNSTSLLSVNEKSTPLRVRLHRMFLSAGQEVLSEIADYIGARSDKTPLFWQFVRDNRDSMPVEAQRQQNLYTRGRVHDLRAAFDRINEKYFNGALDCKITWGKRSKSARVRQRTLGSYTLENDTIRINPVLDRTNIPRYYLEFIVYHEMLHARIYREQAEGGKPISIEGKRRVVHSPEFRRREQQFEDYQRAMRFESG